MVEINLQGKDINLRIGKDTATIDGASVKLDTKAVMKDDRVFVPLRFVSETLGADVKWDGAQNMVVLSFNGSAGDNPDAQPSPTSGDLWGRQVRKTNLPKNAADFPYILNDVPNEMYEMPYLQISNERVVVPIEVFATVPEVKKSNIDLWVDKLKKHYQLVFNADYRTIDYSWANQLYDTNNTGGRYLPDFTKYVDWVKSNHIQIEGSVEPEPSIIYHNWVGYNIRMKVKFRILNFDQDSKVLYDPMYQSGVFQKGKWYSGYADISMGTTTMGNWGPHLAVDNTASLFDNSMIHPME
ncbi:copper amine oxidase N-terminal domain-containing protein, partial [Tumebacillus flagellatus]